MNLVEPKQPTKICKLGIDRSAQRSFEPFMGCLDAARTVIAWDAPGYGASAPLSVDWPSAQDYADALTRLLDRLSIQRAILIGHSLGAIMAARFAAAHAARVAGLALISPAVGYRVAPGAAMVGVKGGKLAISRAIGGFHNGEPVPPHLRGHSYLECPRTCGGIRT